MACEDDMSSLLGCFSNTPFFRFISFDHRLEILEERMRRGIKRPPDTENDSDPRS